jgi:hypothetical protein
VAPAKQPKRSSSKATLDHVIGSTGRDGAYDFVSKTEILDRISPGTQCGASPKVDEFKRKADECARQAAHTADAGMRSSYEELARSWRELADHAETLVSKGNR